MLPSYWIEDANRAYYFIRGCIEKVNEDLTVDVVSLYNYLKENNSNYQKRYQITNEDDKDQWGLIRKTFNNMREKSFKNVEKYICLNKKTKQSLYWKK